MRKRQAERYALLCQQLGSVGFTMEEVDSLLRCSRMLSRWSEHECNGAIQRDEQTHLPYWYNTQTGERVCRTADREAGALRRAKTLCEGHGVTFYHQGDPRGCALWVLRPGDVPAGESPGAYYTRGVPVCID